MDLTKRFLSFQLTNKHMELEIVLAKYVSLVNLILTQADLPTLLPKESVLTATQYHLGLQYQICNYSMLKNYLSDTIADIVYNLTPVVGKTRIETFNQTYPKIIMCEDSNMIFHATIVAHIHILKAYSLYDKNFEYVLETYLDEYEYMKAKIFNENFEPFYEMIKFVKSADRNQFVEYEKLLNIKYLK